MGNLHIVPINEHIADLVPIRGIPDTKTIFVISRPEKILGRVSILVDADESLRVTIDGNSCGICEHVLLPF
jgi:hypothetical protein